MINRQFMEDLIVAFRDFNVHKENMIIHVDNFINFYPAYPDTGWNREGEDR